MSANPPKIADAAGALRRGEIVAFPTETVYGLGADALNPDAVRRVFELKRRPARNPLIVHVLDESMARTVAAQWPRRAQLLAQRFWPGPLTIVCPAGDTLPRAVIAGGDTVALRAPDHPVALDLIRAFGGPIVGPSANPSGSVSPTTAGHVRAAFPDAALTILDGGPCREGIESTVVTVASPRVRILRRGVVSASRIGEALNEPVDDTPGTPGIPDAAPLPAPGMLPRHYAPATPARLFEPEDWPEIIDSAPGPAAVLTHERARAVGPPHTILRMPIDAAGYAAALYRTLHEADALGAVLILIERPAAPGPLWDAVRDRLRRAAAPPGTP